MNFTDEGRIMSAVKIAEQKSGWPKVETSWKDALEDRRFDELGMEVRFKKTYKHFSRGSSF